MLPVLPPALLALADGTVFQGHSFGAAGRTVGEVVFNTALTGYQEILTDPSYCRQIVTLTYPHIGNTGVNGEDVEASKVHAAGLIIKDLPVLASNFRQTEGLSDYLKREGTVAIWGIDTRALTRHLRERGAMRAGVFSGDDAERTPAELLEQVLASPEMTGADLTADVSTSQPYVIPAIGERRFTVAAVDLGIKAMTPYRMAERGIEVHVVPAASTADEIRARGVDGVFFSNGPGDPATADHAVALMSAFLTDRTPVFGICFGNQVLGRALGLGTYKLRYGHRGINQPVQDLATGRVEVTAHNHGFAVDAPRGADFDTPFGRAGVSHVCLNDDVVEGLRCRDVPAFSVQYHPEAAAGPHDARYLFDEFVELMQSHREGRSA